MGFTTPGSEVYECKKTSLGDAPDDGVCSWSLTGKRVATTTRKTGGLTARE